MISFRNISKSFNRGTPNEVRALKDINLEIGKGEYVVLVGANGSGKSTLLNLITGVVQPSAGQIFIGAQEVNKIPQHRRSKWIARVFQDPAGGTAPDLSILDNFRLAALRAHRKGLTIGINATFRKGVAERVKRLGLGLEDKLNQPMGTLSGGQRQSLTLLMSVMDHTDILLLDEPTAALDPRSAKVVMSSADQIIREFGLTAIFISHNMQEALEHGDRIIQIAGGSIRRDFQGDKKRNLNLAEIYGWFG